jgi:hypothetical protein
LFVDEPQDDLKAIYSTIDFDEDEVEQEMFPLDYAWMTMKFVMGVGAVSFYSKQQEHSTKQRPFLKLSFETFMLTLEQKPISNHMQLDLKNLVSVNLRILNSY